MIQKKIAVILSGCGHKDGSEITESVLLWTALTSQNVQIHFFAPNINFHPKDPVTSEPTNLPVRNALTESQRITRGRTLDLATLDIHLFDGLAIVGGMGAVEVLCDWKKHGSQAKILPTLEKAILDCHQQSKPIAGICIAPVIIAKALAEFRPTITIGNDLETIQEVLKTGALHEVCPMDDYVTDRETKVITTPAYMYSSAQPHQIFKGISGLAKELAEMA